MLVIKESLDLFIAPEMNYDHLKIACLRNRQFLLILAPEIGPF